MKVVYTEKAKKHLNILQKQHVMLYEKTLSLIEECRKSPFTGTGKPEPLKYGYSGYWSRRINIQHRLVYKVEGDTLYVVQCMFHY